jgi:hypothetical protein
MKGCGGGFIYGKNIFILPNEGEIVLTKSQMKELNNKAKKVVFKETICTIELLKSNNIFRHTIKEPLR